MEGKEKEAAGAEKKGEAKATEEDEKEIKRKRGRPRKETKGESKEAMYFKKFLSKKEAAGFEIEFRERRKLEHSPLGAQTRSSDKAESSDTNGESEGKKNEADGKKGDKDSDGAEEHTKKTEGAEEAEEENEEVREAGDERAGVKEAEWMDEWKRRVEGKMERMQAAIDKLSGEKREMQGEIKRLKEQYGVASGKIEELENELEEIRGEVEIGRQERELTREKEKANTVSNERIGEGLGQVSEETSGDEARGDEYEKDESETEGSETGANGLCEGGEGGKWEGIAASSMQSGNEACGVIVREYLKCIPERMNEREYEWEMKERGRRKKNVIIRRLGGEEREDVEEIRKIIERKLGIRMDIRRSRWEREGLMLELGSVKNKIELMKRKGGLKETGLWLEDDLTEREKRAKEWLLKIEEEETRNGLSVKVGYMKIRVDGTWYRWDEKQGQIEEVKFQGGGGKER